MLDYSSIQQNIDRTQTRLLLARFREKDLSEDEIADLGLCFDELSDPRSIQPLKEVFEDHSFSDDHRKAACSSWVFLTSPSEQVLREMWQSGDAIQKKVAISEFDGRHEDIIKPILDDSSHPFHGDALTAIIFGFPDRYVDYLIKALKSTDPKNRKSGAWDLLWAEPAAALQPLIDATYDSEIEVQISALDSLRYYASRDVLKRSVDLLTHSKDKRIQEAAQQTHEDVLSMFEGIDLKLLETDFRQWLKPVESLVTIKEIEKKPYKKRKVEEEPWVYTVDEFIERYGLERPNWRDLSMELHRLPWSNAPAEIRGPLADFMVASEDPFLRQAAAKPLALWQFKPRLIQILEDPNFVVRKTAFYDLQYFGVDQKLAEFCWQRLASRKVWGTHAYEILESMAVLAEDKAWLLERLNEILSDPMQSEELKYHAVDILGKNRAKSELSKHLSILQTYPKTNWGLHGMLIDQAKKLSVPLPNLDHLKEVDDLYLQISIHS